MRCEWSDAGTGWLLEDLDCPVKGTLIVEILESYRRWAFVLKQGSTYLTL